MRPIDADALVEWLRPYLHSGDPVDPASLLEDIRARPTVEADPARAVELQRVYPGCTFCLDDAAPALDWVFGLDHVLPGYRYCPMCGRPMTEEAAERLLARWRDAL